MSQEEIDNAKYVVSNAVRRFDELVDQERETGSLPSVSGSNGGGGRRSLRASSSEPRTLTGYINKLSEQVNVVMEMNMGANDAATARNSISGKRREDEASHKPFDE